MVGQKRFEDINILLNRRLEEKRVLIAVHRGSWGGCIIENTIPAYLSALQQGADMFECDLIESTDGVLYAIHDGYEKRLFQKGENIRTMSSEQIDELTYFNAIGEPSGQRVQRFDEILRHFDSGELFNIDRAWDILPQVDAMLRKHPNALRQAIIKTPVQDEYLAFFQECPVKYMYMPICGTMDQVKSVLSCAGINTVGVEAIAKSEDSELFDPQNIQWMKDRGLFVWTNSITLNDHTILSAGFDDNKAIMESPESAWGVLMERGYNVIQTDWPAQLAGFRKTKLG